MTAKHPQRSTLRDGSAVDAIGLSVRCGLHTGECELLDGDVDFDDRGPHELRGEPGEWRLCAVSN